MAQFSFSQMVAAEEKSANNQTPNGNGTNYNTVSFFSLKDDQEKAFVRILFDNPDEDVECLATHEVYVGGKARKVNCLRESARDPLDVCPLCQMTSGIKNRAYLKMIQYTKDAEGNYHSSPKVWERSISFIQQNVATLKSFYPNGLSEAICQITRFGKAGSKDTKYVITPLPNTSPELHKKCPLNRELFKGYKALGTIVLNKTAAEIRDSIQKGEFQVRTQTATNTTAEVATPKNPTVASAPTPTTTVADSIPVNMDDMPF